MQQKKQKDGIATTLNLWPRFTQYSHVVGYYGNGTGAGSFAFHSRAGGAHGLYSFRVVLVP